MLSVSSRAEVFHEHLMPVNIRNLRRSVGSSRGGIELDASEQCPAVGLMGWTLLSHASIRCAWEHDVMSSF